MCVASEVSPIILKDDYFKHDLVPELQHLEVCIQLHSEISFLGTYNKGSDFMEFSVLRLPGCTCSY